MNEDFEYAGECVVCDRTLDMDDAGFCGSCNRPFCWEQCGTWYGNKHACQSCIDERDCE